LNKLILAPYLNLFCERFAKIAKINYPLEMKKLLSKMKVALYMLLKK